MPTAERKLQAVPTQLPASVVKSRQDIAMAKIERNKRRKKLGTYSHPTVRSPVLDTNAVTRRATLQIETTETGTPWYRRFFKWNFK